MSKAIAYSLFGFNKARVDNCFDFNSYLRGLMLCLRFNRLIYPDWQTILETDQSTYAGFEFFFKYLEERNIIRIEKNNNDIPLCEAMLWRLKPVFWKNKLDHTWEFTHVLCRDLDSPATYREAQAVQYWISKDKAMHAITDSISHDLPLLGGMIGIRPDHFSGRLNVNSWMDMMAISRMDLSYKGTDQTFLNSHIYPHFAQKGTDSITQHYFNGHGKTFLSDWHTCACNPPSGHIEGCPNNIPLGIPEELKETNSICGHIGASGFYPPPTFQVLRKHKYKFEDFILIEKTFPDIFYWTKDGTFE